MIFSQIPIAIGSAALTFSLLLSFVSRQKKVKLRGSGEWGIFEPSQLKYLSVTFIQNFPYLH
jgi:hypothetical protein